MKKASLIIGASVVVGVLCVARDADAAGAQAIDRRPSNVPADFVFTTNGYFHPSCILHVPKDHMVLQSGDQLRPDGTILKVPPCSYSRYDIQGNEIKLNDKNS